MSEKYVVEDGLVESLALDLMRAQKTTERNIEDRLRQLVQTPGINGVGDVWDIDVQLQVDGVNYNLSASCTNPGMVVFGDYSYVLQSEEPITYSTTIDSSHWEGYVILSYEVDYDEEGDYLPGYPDETEAAASGSNTRKRTLPTIELSDNAISDETSFTLFKVEVTLEERGFEILEDYRPLIVMRLMSYQNRTVPIPTDINLETVFQSLLLRKNTGNTTNIASPSTNRMSNQVFISLSWEVDPTNVWACEYEISIGENKIKDLVLTTTDQDEYNVLIPAIEGVEYLAKVRAVGCFHHDRSAWSDEVSLVSGTDEASMDLQAPSLTALEINESPSRIIRLICETDYTPPMPHRFQIRQRNSQTSPSTIIHDGAGNAHAFALSGADFSARLVGPGGVCSPYTDWITPTGISYAAGGLASRQYTLSFPVFAKIIFKSTVGSINYEAGSIKCASFYMPYPSGKITDIQFISTGSFILWHTGEEYPIINLCVSDDLDEDTDYSKLLFDINAFEDIHYLNGTSYQDIDTAEEYHRLIDGSVTSDTVYPSGTMCHLYIKHTCDLTGGAADYAWYIMGTAYVMMELAAEAE